MYHHRNNVNFNFLHISVCDNMYNGLSLYQNKIKRFKVGVPFAPLMGDHLGLFSVVRLGYGNPDFKSCRGMGSAICNCPIYVLCSVPTVITTTVQVRNAILMIVLVTRSVCILLLAAHMHVCKITTAGTLFTVARYPLWQRFK